MGIHGFGVDKEETSKRLEPQVRLGADRTTDSLAKDNKLRSAGLGSAEYQAQHLLKLQRVIGNQAVTRLLASSDNTESTYSGPVTASEPIVVQRESITPSDYQIPTRRLVVPSGFRLEYRRDLLKGKITERLDRDLELEAVNAADYRRVLATFTHIRCRDKYRRVYWIRKDRFEELIPYSSDTRTQRDFEKMLRKRFYKLDKRVLVVGGEPTRFGLFGFVGDAWGNYLGAAPNRTTYALNLNDRNGNPHYLGNFLKSNVIENARRERESAPHLEESSFDAIYIEYVGVEKGEWRHLFENARRLLRDGGELGFLGGGCPTTNASDLRDILRLNGFDLQDKQWDQKGGFYDGFLATLADR